MIWSVLAGSAFGVRAERMRRSSIRLRAEIFKRKSNGTAVAKTTTLRKSHRWLGLRSCRSRANLLHSFARQVFMGQVGE